MGAGTAVDANGEQPVVQGNTPLTGPCLGPVHVPVHRRIDPHNPSGLASGYSHSLTLFQMCRPPPF